MGRKWRSASLTDLDLRILDLLCSQRVLTSPQLAALAPEVSARTLRYRCGRLAKHGLLGRTRPYRERGSAPHHLWPTRRGEAIVTGGPPPRGGERHEPNPLFLAHAAGLSEVYVALETGLPAGVDLARFEREADAREVFAKLAAREERAIAPDAFIEITDASGRQLLAFLELDMGTMSHRQLRKKAGGYADYARANAWRERHRFCPALLFITTTEKRAGSFLSMMRKELGRDALLLSCVCDLARRLRLCATEPRWRIDPQGGEAVDLLAVLKEARRPYDEQLAREEVERQEQDAERERLCSDPEALRAHLRSWGGRTPQLDAADGALGVAFKIMLEHNGVSDGVERDALKALAGMLAEPLNARFDDREPTAAERRAFDALVAHYRAAQRERVVTLAGRFGEGPVLRRAVKRLSGDGLLDIGEMGWLLHGAGRDRDSRAEQERLRGDYHAWRDQEARRLAKEQGLLARLRNGSETFFEEIDYRALRRCKSCDEIAYPDPGGAESYAKRHVAQRCHYCGAAALSRMGPPPPAEEEPRSQW
jgi:hypothetical protein